MGANTTIEWTDFTFNPWLGCQKISPACDNCYAEAWDKRYHGGEHWGANAPRQITSDANWRNPLAWNRAAERLGQRRRVFCASLADVFDNAAPAGARERLWGLISETPWLDWQLLTKRPQNIAKMLPSDWGDGYPNVWLGTTVENQIEARRRIPHLVKVPTVIRFLSCEPLLNYINLTRWLYDISWIIVGGESGPGARTMMQEWVRSLRDQCEASGTAFFFKQVGSNHSDWRHITGKGGNIEEFPPDLRIREFPK